MNFKVSIVLGRLRHKQGAPKVELQLLNSFDLSDMDFMKGTIIIVIYYNFYIKKLYIALESQLEINNYIFERTSLCSFIVFKAFMKPIED